MYCIYYNKEYDVAILGDITNNDLSVSLYDLKTLQDKFVRNELDIVNLKIDHFIKEDIRLLKGQKLYNMFNKVLTDTNFPLALKINNYNKYVVIELLDKQMIISICDLEFIKDCIDVKTYSSISNHKLQERGLGSNDNKDRDSRRKEYLRIKTIQARDYRREANISICVRKVEKGSQEESTNIELETKDGIDIEHTNLQVGKDEKGSQEESTNIELETKDGVDINRKVELDFGDESDDEIIDDFKPMYSEYDSDCEVCHGSGRIEEDGFIRECSCGAKIKKLRESNKGDIKPVFRITNAIKEDVVSYGLIPEEYRDIEYNEKVMYDILNQRYKGKRVRVQNYSNFVNTLSTILASCKTGQKLKHSYIIYGDKGFGKKTFVYTCLKYLYARNVPLLCKYTSLSELGLLKAEAIKRASAINNLGYYTRDNDRELIQQSLVEESNKAVTAILNEWFNIIKNESGLTTAFKTFKYKIDTDVSLNEQNDELKDRKIMLGKQFEDAIIRNAYERMAEEERIINYGKEYCGRLINTWEDYINAPIVFVFFSGIGERRFETEVLQILLNIRGAKALPTIAITETALITAQDECTMFVEDNSGKITNDTFKAKSYFWNNMLSDASDIDIRKMDKNKLKDEISNNIEYDRMIYIYSYAKYQDKLKVGIDI